MNKRVFVIKKKKNGKVVYTFANDVIAAKIFASLPIGQFELWMYSSAKIA